METTKKMLDEWRNVVVCLYKNKSNTQRCINYHRTKLMGHTYYEIMGESNVTKTLRKGQII